MEVPEIEEGIVEIKGVAREPGHRSKMAVSSNEPGVDPVGACVGPKGSRVRMVVNELRGEKIDVVPWSDNPAELVANALQPAKVKEVRIDESTGTAMVIVPDYQLSLAIGKEGQNARLAARLTGWRIDIKSETQVSEDARAAAAPAPAPDAGGRSLGARGPSRNWRPRAGRGGRAGRRRSRRRRGPRGELSGARARSARAWRVAARTRKSELLRIVAGPAGADPGRTRCGLGAGPRGVRAPDACLRAGGARAGRHRAGACGRPRARRNWVGLGTRSKQQMGAR